MKQKAPVRSAPKQPLGRNVR